MRQNILITGASSGLGMEMARQFAAMGRNLALCARRTDRLDALRDELLAKHPNIRIFTRVLDVNKHDDVFTVFRAFEADLGRIDRVVVNAGIGKGMSIGTGHFEANRMTLETNMIAALAQCEAACEIFRKQNAGHLVCVSSMTSLRGFPKTVTSYAASKAALASLSDGIRLDLRRTPIRVSTLMPGYIESEMTAQSRSKKIAMVDVVTGTRSLVNAMEREVTRAYLPRWPWAFMAPFMRLLPEGLWARLNGS
jgi:short-subunit dehydrogenase